MPKHVTLPPPARPGAEGLHPGGWWHEDPDDGRVVCDLCPRACRLKAGDRGFCFVRENRDGEMVLTTYGRSTGFCVDPIEKKPLNHFYPGTSVLSFGTAGCNLGCKFCQNWDISKSREIARLSERADPGAIAEAARALGCKSVAFTYNDPVIWAEYAIDTARACRAAGVKTVAVTAGYITPEARGPFYEFMDAANVDLKAFSEAFYHKVTYSHLQPVLDTLAWLKAETDVWFEITNLVIPRENDSEDEIRAMCGWVLEHCGDQVPVHFTAFHPDFRMNDRSATPHATLLRAHEIAKSAGLKHVYTGNVNDVTHQSTYCAHCGGLLIERNWYELGAYHLKGSRCGRCGGEAAGRFEGRPGDWGRKRVPVDISGFGRPSGPPPQFVTLSPALPTKDPRVSNRPAAPTPIPTPAPAEAAAPTSPAGPGAPRLTGEQTRHILGAAARHVAAAIVGRPASLDDPGLAGAAELTVGGAYVTLKRNGRLRACTGLLGAPRPLGQALAHAATHTATEDHRLPPISVTELPYLDLDVNLLFALRPVDARGRDRLAAVEAGRHGLRIDRGGRSGLLLPGVAVEHGWDSETFLRQVCRKAGLPTTAWEDDETALLTFESVELGGPFDGSALAAHERSVARSEPGILARVASAARANVAAMARGMTPSYYLPGAPDGQVSGVALSVTQPGRAEPAHYLQLALRPGVPLQATLFGLCEAAARGVAASGADPSAVGVGVTVLSDPAMHGTLAEPDLRGLDPARRALLLIESNTTCWVYDPAATPEALLEAARSAVPVLNPERAGLFSLEAQSTFDRVVFRSSPEPVPAADRPRPPAQAGRFYPADPAALNRLVDGLLAAIPRRPEAWPVAMVPHAGLRFSGKVAASVFNRLEVPETVLVIGPKHTPYGVDWAVDPHDAWAIPGATLAGDPALARALVEAIPGLQADAAAHRVEHAVEVELPFLARLAPHARVVGLAVGGGASWELCRRFAAGLADVLHALPRRPLILVSSDMNHFATDEENRRLDEVALRAMERLDPEHLLDTVTDHDISMCGVVPAVIAMEALRRLGGLTACERVAYATSADASGDRSRVVGYAGMLLR